MPCILAVLAECAVFLLYPTLYSVCIVAVKSAHLLLEFTKNAPTGWSIFLGEYLQGCSWELISWDPLPPAQVFLGESDSVLHVHQLETSVFKAEPQAPPLTLYVLPLHRPSKGPPTRDFLGA